MNNTTNIISGVVLVVIMAGVGFLYYADVGGRLLSSTPLSNGGTAATSSVTGPERDQTLQRLNRLEDIDIDTEFLSRQIFTSFENFGIAIQSQPVGRENPFRSPQVRIPATITDDQADFSTTTPTPNQLPDTNNQGATSSVSTTSLEQLPSTGSATTAAPTTGS